MAKTAALAFRVRVEVKDALEKAAAADDRSVSNLIDRIVQEWLSERGYLKLNEIKAAAVSTMNAAKP